MPLRQVVVDFGDGDHTESTQPPWPTNSQIGGGNAAGNFYKNHRGLKPNSENDIYCDDGNLWGLTDSSCDTSYFNYEHDYFCSTTYAGSLPVCTFDSTGLRLLNSPCKGGGTSFASYSGHCVFQPRVNVKDNWGWCNGTCNSNPDTTDDGKSNPDDGGSPNCYASECNTTYCPGEGTNKTCPDRTIGTTSNPWTNFNGYIIVEP